MLCLESYCCFCYSLLYDQLYAFGSRIIAVRELRENKIPDPEGERPYRPYTRTCYGDRYNKPSFSQYPKESTLQPFPAMTHPNPASLQQPELGDLIRDLRQAMGLTQEKFAAQVGVSFPTVNRWENKRATPSPLAMEKLAAMVKQVRKSGTDLMEKYGAKQA